jgi:hypothetical protein
MPIHLRPRNNGCSFELRVTRNLLPKTHYRDFDTREQARAFDDGAKWFLVQNIIPVYLLPTPRLEFADIAGAIRLYDKEIGVPHSTATVLATVCAGVGGLARCLDWVANAYGRIGMLPRREYAMRLATGGCLNGEGFSSMPSMNPHCMGVMPKVMPT